MSSVPVGESGGKATTASASDQAGAVTATAKEKAADLTSEVREHAQELLAESRSTLRAQAETQGGEVSRVAKDLAGELKSMGSAGETRLGGLMEQGADQIERLARRFDEGGLDAVSKDARRFARQRPAVFIASTFAVGFAAGRLLKHADRDEMKDAVSAETSGAGSGPGISASTMDPSSWPNAKAEKASAPSNLKATPSGSNLKATPSGTTR